MPIYTHNNQIGQPVNISTFVTNAQNAAAPGGPLPRLTGTGTNLGTHASALQNIGPVAHTTKAWGLLTCAAVIYFSTDPNAVAAAWVHHANAGHVGNADINDAVTALGNPQNASIFVIYAHPGNHDNGYAQSIASIAATGIPANNIIEIPNLLIPQFGINNIGWIGC